jgi:16S rRNA (cytosine967-C5)-methyltransferase
MKPRNAIENSGRTVASDIVRQWLERGSFPDRNLEQVTLHRGFVTEVVYGTVRWYGALEAVLRLAVPRPPGPAIEAVLLTAMYQLLYMDHTEAYAVVNESVGLVKARGGQQSVGLVNAVLRRVEREQDDIRSFLRRQPYEVQVSHPRRLVTRWRRQYGERPMRELCSWNNERPEVVLSVNRHLVAFEAFRARLSQEGIEARPHPAEPLRCLVLPSGVPVNGVPGYEDGLFLVQDPATLAPPRLLAPRPGERVLDLCAAPGGKTAALAEAMRGQGVLVAVDLHQDRIERLQENLDRLRWDFVEVVRGDAANRESLRNILGRHAAEGFDRILIDAPCSNTGVLRRRPDARWRFDERRLAGLRRTQEALLDSASSLLGPGGSLVYSTCSLEPEEDEDLATGWTGAHEGFTLAKAKKIFPPRSGTDGGYAALIVRR